MTDTLAQAQYQLLFHGYAIGPAGVEAKSGGHRMPKMLFSPGGKISITAIGPDESQSSIKTIEIAFKAQGDAPPSPLGDGKNARYVWHRGNPPVTIGETAGKWTFTATLLDHNGKGYAVPDPEFQVGDGSDHGL